MSQTFTYTLQNVNGDPKVSGGNINITTSVLEQVVFTEDIAVSLSDVAAGDTITVSGVVYNYEYIGSADVRGDPSLPAAYIRIVGPIPSGGTLSVGDTFAMDLTGEPGDPDYPNLPNGNTRARVSDLNTTEDVQFPGVVCFAAGTRLRTETGDKSVETLQAGELIQTLDNGLQPIVWIGHTALEFDATNETQKPVLIKAGALGGGQPMRDLAVSPQHKILLPDPQGQAVLYPAKSLVGVPGIRWMYGKKAVTYYHVMLPQHGIILSEGLPSESFYPGPTGMRMLKARQKRAIESLFPGVLADPTVYGPLARPALTRRAGERAAQAVFIGETV